MTLTRTTDPHTPQVGDRAYFDGFSVVIEDHKNAGPSPLPLWPMFLVRYVATNNTEWIPASNVRR